jgi:hypothetical protein
MPIRRKVTKKKATKRRAVRKVAKKRAVRKVAKKATKKRAVRKVAKKGSMRSAVGRIIGRSRAQFVSESEFSKEGIIGPNDGRLGPHVPFNPKDRSSPWHDSRFSTFARHLMKSGWQDVIVYQRADPPGYGREHESPLYGEAYVYQYARDDEGGGELGIEFYPFDSSDGEQILVRVKKMTAGRNDDDFGFMFRGYSSAENALKFSKLLQRAYNFGKSDP